MMNIGRALLITSICFFTGEAAGQTKSDGEFRDDFTGSSLHPAWEILGENPDRWALIDGNYLLIVSSTAGTNQFMYKGGLGSDYIVEIAVSAELRENVTHENRVYLGIQQDKENGIYISIGGYNYEGVVFTKLFNGEISTSRSVLTSIPTEFKLRLAKKGVEIEGSYDAGGGWTSMGKQFFIGLEGKPVFGAYNKGNVADAGVRVDYVQIVPR